MILNKDEQVGEKEYSQKRICVFTFRKSNQRISACVQGTPRRGNEHIAQGIALGMMKG